MKDAVDSGWPVRTAELDVSQELIDNLVALGGYSHPLFNPTAQQQSGGLAAPMMGQGVLLLAGGLVEQSGALDDVIALLEFRNVRFHSMLRAGSQIQVVLDLLTTRKTSSGKRVSEYTWAVVDETARTVLEAVAVMLRQAEGSSDESAP